MAIDEIEIPGTSLSLRCLTFKTDSLAELFDKIQREGDPFSIDPETAGFHDMDASGKLIRGFFSVVVPFEVEHLVEGIVTKTLLKRVETCEFFAMPECLFVTGKNAPQKILEHTLAGLSGYGVNLVEFEFRHMSQFQDRVSMLKSIALTNPKDRDVRRARLAGRIESYTEYNVIDPRNHGIENVSGLVDTPLGPVTVTVARKGGLRLNVRRGFILTMECLLWLLDLIREEKPPEHIQKSE
jgi:hypothetical protein